MVERIAGYITLTISKRNYTNKYFTVDILQTVTVNKPPALRFESTILPILVSILLVNTVSIMLIIKRDKTLVNKLLTLDCIANIVLTVIGSIQQSKANGMGVELYCAPVSVLYLRCFIWLLIYIRDDQYYPYHKLSKSVSAFLHVYVSVCLRVCVSV